MQSALGSYARTGSSVNHIEALPPLEATFFVSSLTCEEGNKTVLLWPTTLGASARLRPREGAMLGLELLLDPGERIEGAVECGDVVGGHHAGSQQCSARWYSGV
jgi:hypothetical protein